VKRPRWGPTQTELIAATIAFAILFVVIAFLWWIQP